MELGDIDNDIILGDGTEETAPQPTVCSDGIFDLAFHPSAAFVAAGLVSGAVEVYEFRRNEARLVANLQEIHSGGITGMEFSEDGRHLITVSSDRTINVLDCATQQRVLTIPKGKGNPHKYGISAVNVADATVVSTGDDDGMIVIWDLRQKKATAKYHEHGDFVSQMLFFSEVNQIISSSGDTCVGAYDMRKSQIIDFSEKRKDELLCLAFIPATNDIICGTNSGDLPVWRYGSWSRPYDINGNHPKECETILSYNDNIIMTGACDGLVRVIQVYPARRILCHLGAHEGKKYGNGISRIRISHDRTLLATCNQDRNIRWHDVEFLGSEEQLDSLRSKAERRHMDTIRKANAEADADAAKTEEAAEESASNDSEEEGTWETDDEDEDGDDDAPDEEEEEGAEEVLAEAQAAEPQETRREKRARVAAAKWLKEAQKEKINFKFERRRRRVGGFWGDLTRHE